MKTVAFVFARGGSKGLPGKNLMKLGGIPLVAHSILTAKSIASVDEVFVSTDSDEIAEVSSSYGARIIERPPELATDKAAEWKAWQHAIHWVRESGESIELFLSLPATAPLRTKEDVENALKKYSNCDVVITVTPSHRSPYFNMIEMDNDGNSSLVIPSSIRRRQDSPKTYDITTVAYVASPDFVLSSDNLFQGRVKSSIVAKTNALDIDDEVDFELAEFYWARRTQC